MALEPSLCLIEPWLYLRQLDGSTYKGMTRSTLGGVGRNVAEGLMRLNQDPLFISAIGDDAYGRMVLERMQDIVSMIFN